MAEQALTESQIAERVRDLTGWAVRDGMLRKRYETDGWPTTLMLVNAIGFLAEAADHHPDLAVKWGSVEVALSTHTANGITEKDVALARRIDALATWRPEAGSPLRGVKRDFVKREA